MNSAPLQRRRQGPVGSLRLPPSARRTGARDVGFSLEKVGDFLGLVACHAATCARAQAVASRRIEPIGAKITDLRRIETVLGETMAHCSRKGGPECAVSPMTRAERLQGAEN
ncbi:MerR family DNA-binding protein [Allgaiera indica]|uniref:MerR family DNA-binding protein n=1 Tax=Allgaiera indica TaxID=765699 RepID=UPI0009DD2FE7